MEKNNSKEKPLSSIKTENRRIYFDWAASAPLINTFIDVPYGNPSSLHSEGKAAKTAIEEARERCAAVLKVPPETLYFTSGGTESNGIALFSNLMRIGNGRILSSMAEHASIREGMQALEKVGKPTGNIAVDSSGRVTIETLKKAFEKYDDTRFVSIMSVNNETGAVTGIASLKDVIRNKKGAPIHFHCDLVQAVGKIPVDIQGWEIDSASISAHKIGGPRGIGLLYLRKPLDVFYSGGGQERGIRGGTENTYGAAALANCLEQITEEFTVNQQGVGCRESGVEDKSKTTLINFFQAEKRMNKLMSALLKIDRCALIPKERSMLDSQIPGHQSPVTGPLFSPYILQAAFKDIPGEVMARALDDLGFAVSTGSACSSSSPERPVLASMGVEEKLRIEGIRISQGYSTTDDDIDQLIVAITEILKFL